MNVKMARGASLAIAGGVIGTAGLVSGKQSYEAATQRLAPPALSFPTGLAMTCLGGVASLAGALSAGTASSKMGGIPGLCVAGLGAAAALSGIGIMTGSDIGTSLGARHVRQD